MNPLYTSAPVRFNKRQNSTLAHKGSALQTHCKKEDSLFLYPRILRVVFIDIFLESLASHISLFLYSSVTVVFNTKI